MTYALLIRPGHEYDLVTYPALILIVGGLIIITQQTKILGGSRLILLVHSLPDPPYDHDTVLFRSSDCERVDLAILRCRHL
jgi:hypothetical protein